MKLYGSKMQSEDSRSSRVPSVLLNKGDRWDIGVLPVTNVKSNFCSISFLGLGWADFGTHMK